jgi:signal transduction histidine kinase
MRLRLGLVTAAVTLLIIVSFVVPLGILARRQAADRALSAAERQAESIATALAVTGSFTGPDVTAATASAVLSTFGSPDAVTIHLADGTIVGPADADDDDDLVAIARSGTAFTAETSDGAAVLVPILTGSTTTVVRVEVSAQELSQGVAAAWGVLGLLAVGLVAVALLAADRLGRSIVTPVAELEAAAGRLGRGDLEARVNPSGPPELAAVGRTFNELTRRLAGLLQAEREAAADLSHGLRTPLTALRLQIESVTDATDRATLLEDLQRVESAVDRVIAEARTIGDAAPEAIDIAAVARERAAYWEPLAADQNRLLTVIGAEHPIIALAAAGEPATVLDTLLENVFAHTEPGVEVAVRLSSEGTLSVEDAGPGFRADAAMRGASGSSSTGLGLDIVRRIAERNGGSFEISQSELGGSRVSATFPLVGG